MHGLPQVAAERLARAKRSGVRTSLLSASSAAGIEVVGLEPVGEVMGCVVQTPAVRHPTFPWQRPGWQWRQRSFDRFSQPYLAALRTGHNEAMRRLRREAKALRADGVVDVRLVRTELGGADEYLAMGTAVRARSKARPRSVFTTDLCGGDVAKLMLGGWMPTQLVWAGAARGRNKAFDPQLNRRYRYRFCLGNVEMQLYTAMVNSARAGARRRFEELIRVERADTGLVSEMSLSVWEPADKVVAAIAVVRGTVITRFRAPGPAPTRTLTVMPLGGGQSAGSRCPNAGQ
jgi:hypothetical protein